MLVFHFLMLHKIWWRTTLQFGIWQEVAAHLLDTELHRKFTWWRHQMEAFSALLASQRSVTRSFDVFFNLPLKKYWVNSRGASDLRRHRAHYDVIVMKAVMSIVTKDRWWMLETISVNETLSHLINKPSIIIRSCFGDGTITSSSYSR